MRPEAWVEEANYQARLDRERKKYLRGCPWCCVCDEQIEEPKCYQLIKGDFETCVHESCFENEVKKLRKTNVATAIKDTLEELLNEETACITTPHEEV